MLTIHTILHPTDFSERSNDAFRLACSLARDHGSRLVIVHIGIYPLEGMFLAEAEGYREELTGKLRRLQGEAPQLRVETRLIMAANPATEILEFAHEIQCDLIVIGTHGRTGLGRLLMGSVAEQVVRRASCPVLTVKTPFPRAGFSEECAPEKPAAVVNVMNN